MDVCQEIRVFGHFSSIETNTGAKLERLELEMPNFVDRFGMQLKNGRFDGEKVVENWIMNALLHEVDGGKLITIGS